MNNKVSSGLFWSYGERILAQLVSFIVSLVLARLIAPENFGVVSLVMIFIDICNVFVTSGLGTGLIQKKDTDDIDFSTVFWLSLSLGVCLYLLIFFCAPVIQHFFGYSELTVVIRVMGLRLILASINTIQHAYVSRKMIFKKFFFATLIGTVISAIIGIYLAQKGFGVWAIVVQYLCNTTIDTIVLFFTIDWRPRFIFKFERLGYFIRFGWKVLAASLIDNIYTNLRSLVIGKRYTSADLAYYNKGIQFPAIIVTNINSSIARVMFPVMSVDQNDKQKLRNTMKRSVEVSAYILSPLLVGLIVVSRPVVILILTEKWLECVKYMYVFSITYLFMPIHALNEQAIKATGHSEVSLKVEIVKKVFGILLIVVAVLWLDNAFALALSFFAYSLIALVINAMPGKRLYDYGWAEQLKDVSLPLGISLIMGVVIYPLSIFIESNLLLILAQVIMGGLTYIGFSALLKFKTYCYLLSRAKQIISARKAK